MLSVKEPKIDVGVIVGRFQVHALHKAHMDLIESVLERHDRVYIFLGLSSLRNTINNPLDYRSRFEMIRDAFGDKVEVRYIADVPDDRVWSKNLDSQIRSWVNPGQSVVLYGSRDSFLKRYSGSYRAVELESREMISGTEVRRKVSNSYCANEAYRAGMIAATSLRYPTVYTTVDVAVVKEAEGLVLMCMKPNEDKWRFIGGFADVGSVSFESDAAREVMEESGVSINGVKYIGSTKIDDWRYRSETDCIKTMFFVATYFCGRPEGGDDVSAVKWFKLEELDSSSVVKEHLVLVDMLNKNRSDKGKALEGNDD